MGLEIKSVIKYFFIVTSSCFVFFIGYRFICNYDKFGEKNVEYNIIVEDCTNILYNTKVKINGFTVGKIKKIEFLFGEYKTKIYFIVDKRIKINENSIVSIDCDLLSRKTLNIKVGEGKPLNGNTTLRHEDNSKSLDEIMNNIKNIINTVNSFVKKIDDNIDLKLEKIQKIINGIESGIIKTGEFLDSVNSEKGLIGFLEQLNEVLKQIKNSNITNLINIIDDFVNKNKPEIEKIIKWIDEFKNKNKNKGIFGFSI